MSDDADIANELAEMERSVAIGNITGFEIDEGEPGHCDECGDWSPRLVDATCVACRCDLEKRAKRIYGS